MIRRGFVKDYLNEKNKSDSSIISVKTTREFEQQTGLQRPKQLPTDIFP